MKSIIIGTVQFFVISIIIFSGISILYDFRVRQRDNFFIQLDDFDHPDTQPIAVFLGDSRVAFGIKQRALPRRYYNFSYPGENLRQTYLRAQHVLRTKPSVKYLVLAVDDHVFATYREIQHEYFIDQFAFSTVADLKEIYPVSTRRIMRGFLVHSVPLLAHEQRQILVTAARKDLQAWFKGVPAVKRIYLDECRDFQRDVERNWQRYNVEERRAAIRRNLSSKYQASVLEAALLEILDKLFALTARHGVRIIGLRTPMVPEFRDAQDGLNLDQVMRVLESKPFMAILHFEDFMADRADLYTDPDHLTDQGAELLTTKLVNRLDRTIGINASTDPKVSCGGPATIQNSEAAPQTSERHR